MKKRSLLIFAILSTLAMPGFGNDESPAALEEVVQALESPFKAGRNSTIRDFKGDFSQESRITSLDRVQVGRGRVAVKFDPAREGRLSATMFRWDYEHPTEQEIVSNGKTMWVYLPENRQVIQSNLEDSPSSRANDPLTFLTGLGNLSRDFSIRWASPKRDVDGNHVLELQPRKPSTMIRRLLIAVKQEAVSGRSSGTVFPISSTTVFDPNGNSTTIEFSGTRTNTGIPDSHFNFRIPDGVEVVHPAGSGMGF